MRNLIRADVSKLRRTTIRSGNARFARRFLKLPDECLVDVMLFLRRRDVDTATITCRTFHRILSLVVVQLPLRSIHYLCLDFNNGQGRHQVIYEDQEGSPWQRQIIGRIGQWLSRLSHCYFHQLTVWAFHLEEFSGRRFSEDIVRHKHVGFHVKSLVVGGKSESANFVRLYNYLMQPGHVMEYVELSTILLDVMRMGLEIPGVVESVSFSAEEIVKVRYLPHSLEPVRLIFAYTSHRLRGFEDRVGFKGVWPDGNYREAVRWIDGLDSPVVVYRPLVNRFTGQKLRVMVKQPSTYYKFAGEEKFVLHKESASYAEANCVMLFVGCGRGRGYALNRAIIELLVK